METQETAMDQATTKLLNCLKFLLNEDFIRNDKETYETLSTMFRMYSRAVEEGKAESIVVEVLESINNWIGHGKTALNRFLDVAQEHEKEHDRVDKWLDATVQSVFKSKDAQRNNLWPEFTGAILRMLDSEEVYQFTKVKILRYCVYFLGIHELLEGEEAESQEKSEEEESEESSSSEEEKQDDGH